MHEHQPNNSKKERAYNASRKEDDDSYIEDMIPKRDSTNALRIENVPDAPWKDKQAQCRKEKLYQLRHTALLPILDRSEQKTNRIGYAYNEEENAYYC